MERGNDWTVRVAKEVGKRVAYFRELATDDRGRPLSVQALSDRCGKLGLPLGRPAISKLENGLRQSITVDETIVLARALNVSPADLVFPLGQSSSYELLPGQHTGTWEAVLWFSGMAAEPGQPADDDAGVVHLYQLHAVILQEWRGGRAAGPSSERMAVAALRTVRAEMRKRALLLPELPSWLAWVDNGDAR